MHAHSRLSAEFKEPVLHPSIGRGCQFMFGELNSVQSEGGQSKKSSSSQMTMQCDSGVNISSEGFLPHRSQSDYIDLENPDEVPVPLRAIPPCDNRDNAVLSSFPLETYNGVFHHTQNDIASKNPTLTCGPSHTRMSVKPPTPSDLNSLGTMQLVIHGYNFEDGRNFSELLCSNPSRIINEDAMMLPVPRIEYLRPHRPGQGIIVDEIEEKENLTHKYDEDMHGLTVAMPTSANIADSPACSSVDCHDKNARNRLRRAKISEGISALKESCPNSGKRDKGSTLDDTIDYIKLLKFKIKTLSQTRLGGENTAYPLLYLEGFGHYLPHRSEPRESLEEAVEHLMELSMPAAVGFLERRGLTILPTTLTDLLRPS